MPIEVLERVAPPTRGRPAAPSLVRRLTTTTALLLGSVIAVGEAPAPVQAQPPAKGNRSAAAVKEKVDVSKLSANEVLAALPPTIKLGGGEASVEKYEAEEAKYLMIVLRNVHEHPDKTVKLPEYALRAIHDSGKENEQILYYLLREWGVSYVGFEGIAEEQLPRILRQRDAIRDTLPDQTRKDNRSPSSERVKESQRELLTAWQEMVPIAGDAVLKGELNLVAVEREETANATKSPDATGRTVYWKREETCLDLLSKNLAGKTNRVSCIWGAGHWDIDSFSGMPRMVHEWNIHPRHEAEKFSAAIITPPSVKKFLETREKEQKKQ